MSTTRISGLVSVNQTTVNFAALFDTAGSIALRYGLVVILTWIGAMKFTAYESEGIRPFVENSPAFSWTYSAFGIQGMSNILGVIEITMAIAIASRPWNSGLSAVGSLLAVGMFLGTLSFLVTTPEAWVPSTGYLALSVPGQFLLKDVVLLGAALSTTGEAYKAWASRQLRKN